jgi:Septum formation
MMEHQPTEGGGPRNSYAVGLVVAGVAAVVLLTAGVFVAGPFGGGEGEEAAAPSTTRLPTSTQQPSTTQAPTTNPAPTTTRAQAEDVGAFVIEDGDCINLPDGNLVESVKRVPCAQAHDAEVYSLFDLAEAAAAYPGADAVNESAADGCVDRFADFVGVAYEYSVLDVFYLHPTEESWNQIDDREVVCLVTPMDGGQLTGTMRGSGQ